MRSAGGRTSTQTNYGRLTKPRRVFTDRLSNNEVYKHVTTAKTQNLDLYYSARPYVQKRKRRPELGADFIYDVTITTRYLGRFFEYERILSATRPLHKFVIHIMLDSFQHSLRVTFPSTLDSTTIIEAVDRFASVAHNSFSVVPLVSHSDLRVKDEPNFESYWEQSGQCVRREKVFFQHVQAVHDTPLSHLHSSGEQFIRMFLGDCYQISKEMRTPAFIAFPVLIISSARGKIRSMELCYIFPL